MKKKDWQKHIIESENYSFDNTPESFKRLNEITKRHKENNCSICKERLKTKRANIRRKERESVMDSLGLIKVKGPVSGKTYWE